MFFIVIRSFFFQILLKFFLLGITSFRSKDSIHERKITNPSLVICIEIIFTDGGVETELLDELYMTSVSMINVVIITKLFGRYLCRYSPLYTQ